MLGSQSISNQSQGFNDYRYQKALKQISKLINVNRQIKLQSQRIKNQFEQINIKNQQLLSINTQLENQLQCINHQYQTLSMNYSQLQDYCKKSQFQQKQLKQDTQVQSLHKVQIQHKHEQQIQQLQSQFRQQMNQMMIQIHSKQSQINQLQSKLQYINELQQSNHQLQQNYSLLIKQNQQLHIKINQLTQEIINMSSKIKQQPNQDLINKLKINQQWIKSLNQDNYNLKQKVLEDEYKKQRQKCNQSLFQNVKDAASLINISSTNANDLLIREYIKQVQKKLKKIEDDKHRIQHKYNKLKHNHHQLQLKSNTLQKQVNLLTVKVNGYQQLTQRQQKQIQKMIQQYHRQMDKVITSKRKITSTQTLNQPIDKHINHLNKKQKQLQLLVESLQSQLIKIKTLTQQKDKLIKYYQVKIQALQDQRIELQKTNFDLQQQLSTYQNMDLSKTSKNYNKGQNILKTHTSVSKTGSKVFVINGKKYQTQLLKNRNNQNKQEQENNKNGLMLGKLQNETWQNQRKMFPSGQIEYISSQRSYGNDQQLVNA